MGQEPVTPIDLEIGRKQQVLKKIGDYYCDIYAVLSINCYDTPEVRKAKSQISLAFEMSKAVIGEHLIPLNQGGKNEG